MQDAALESARVHQAVTLQEVEMFKIGLSGQMFDAESIWDHLTAAACGYDTVELRSTHVAWFAARNH